MKTNNFHVGLKKALSLFVIQLFLVFVSVCWGWGEATEYHYCTPGYCPNYCVCLNMSQEDLDSHKEHLFGETSFPEVLVITTCESVEEDNDNGCGLCEEPATDTIELPGLLESSTDIKWSNQGANVKVTDCGSITNAHGTVEFNSRSDFLQVGHSVIHFDCISQVLRDSDEHYHFAGRSTSHHFKADFNDKVFVVNDSKSPVYFTGSIEVGLVNDKCETLEKALNLEVTISHQMYHYVAIHGIKCDEDDTSSPTPQKYELSDVEEDFATIGVVFEPNDFLECNCPGDEGAPDSCEDSGCSSGSCSDGDGPELNVGNASTSVGETEEGTLAANGSPDINMEYDAAGNIVTGTPEVNAAGGWIHATNYPYQADTDSVSYVAHVDSEDDNVIDSISYSFEVSVSGTQTYHYSYEMTGNWVGEVRSNYVDNDPSIDGFDIAKVTETVSAEQVALEAFLEAARGNVKLDHITNSNGDTILEFDYDNGNLIRQTSFDENGNPNGYIRYAYENDVLVRIWAGLNENDFDSVTYPDDPTGGRWINVGYNSGGYLESAAYGNCSSCTAALEYERENPYGSQITKIMEADGTVLETYAYDSKGRFISYTIGDGANELKVNEWLRSDYDPADSVGTTGNNIMVRRDYVDNTQFRAKVFFADDNGAKTKEIRYHQLQTDPDWLAGPYSVYKFYHLDDEIDGLRYVTEQPKGNKLIKYYDTEGNVIKIEREGSSGPEAEVEVEYSYGSPITYEGSTQYTVSEETNAYGGITSYAYYTGVETNNPSGNKFNLKTQTAPLPGVGISGIGIQNFEQVTTYVYDAQDRIDYEYHKDSNVTTNVYTKYVYDFIGNLKRRHEDCTDYTSSNPTTGLITYYDYNEYRELYKTAYPSGKVERLFYSGAGTMIAQAVYDDDATDSAVSATIYVYEDGKLKTRKTAKMDTSFTFTNSVTEIANINWVLEGYEYDVYGRREAVISDDDVTGEALRTEFSYNNLEEIVKVLKPDKRYKKTIRDGRSLVVQEITGVEISGVENDKATTQYFYNLNGNLEKKIDPTGVTEIYQYDSKGRMIRSRKGK